MSSTAHNLLLADDWDLHVNSAGELDRCFESYSIAQEVSNAFRLFTDDAWYFPEKGIPHFVIELNKNPKISVLKVRLREAALQVNGVKDCRITILTADGRDLTGFAALTLENGDEVNVNF